MNNSIMNLRKELLNLVEDMKCSNCFPYDEKGGETDAYFNNQTNEVMLQFEVQGTQYEGRSELIEYLKDKDTISIVREPDNKYSSQNLSVRNKDNLSLGNVPAEICEIVSPLVDKNYLKIVSSTISYIEPLSKRSARCKKALLYVKIILKLKDIKYTKENSSIICLLGGDQTWCWVQKLQILKCDIPFDDAKKLFELHNRFNSEYENDNYSYLGLDNLADEVKIAREKMKSKMQKGLSYSKNSEKEEFVDYVLEKCEQEPDRYSNVKKYFNNDYFDEFCNISNIFLDHAIEEEKYYWEDHCRITEQEWNMLDGFNHWYDIIELYNPEESLPFDMNDEDIVSIFGFDKFEDFGDLSYGC